MNTWYKLVESTESPTPTSVVRVEDEDQSRVFAAGVRGEVRPAVTLLEDPSVWPSFLINGHVAKVTAVQIKKS